MNLDINTNNLLENIVISSKKILKENLLGIYLHGSIVLGSFNPLISDLDYIIVVKEKLLTSDKEKIMQDVIEKLLPLAPKKGLEFHILLTEDCRKVIEEGMEFDFHFSDYHLENYLNNPLKYIEEMHGVDGDLPVHIAVINQSGKALYGPNPKEIFSIVSKDIYWNSVLNDISDATVSIISAPTYTILNLCRSLAFRKTGTIFSKVDGGNWVLNNITSINYEFKLLILSAINEYEGQEIDYSDERLVLFASYMQDQLNLQ
ncbi:aminoglycoside adenylyltransferase domain-containing protein [Floricoccus penangensis]|uniref:aminoglycoside adenylyltransferase domain-containing protein n=1 Tax=Floricoccus penangensis TaxID=1859475 RepID=UPI00203D56FF|nr:aminoglycoside adenylyltransferase domain-containing protein [Floricoccus penangensis]URZ86505.1 DUF4111 domain-containing protein [Floricoccus penangensis]